MAELTYIIKPCAFTDWAIDLIEKTHPTPSKGHSFIMVATKFFTKWVKALLMKKVEHIDEI